MDLVNKNVLSCLLKDGKEVMMMMMMMMMMVLNLQYPFESLFRSLQYAMLDNSCREYLFICDFFMVSAAAALDLFNSIFGKTLAMFMVCICGVLAIRLMHSL